MLTLNDVNYIQDAIDHLQTSLKYAAKDPVNGFPVNGFEDERLEDLYWQLNKLWLALQKEKTEGRYDS